MSIKTNSHSNTGLFGRFIGRSFNYGVKHLSGMVARVYVQNSELLRSAGMYANSSIHIKYGHGRIEVTLDPNGKQKIMDTGRGELLELRNKSTGTALKGLSRIVITIRQGKVIISAHPMDIAEKQRVNTMLNKLQSGTPLREACLFSGLGMLSLSIKDGLKKAGIDSQLAFANDFCEKTMMCNMEGNPIWHDASDDVHVVVDDLNSLHFYDIPEVDYVTIGYPCVGFSLLADKNNLDTSHPTCGHLFISLVSTLRRMNPAFFIIENTPRFKDSESLRLIKKSMPDYRFQELILDGHDYQELESRKRTCVVALSQSLPDIDANTLVSLYADEPKPVLRDFLEPIGLDDPAWSKMEHVKARDAMAHIGYRNCLYNGSETAITTVPASYTRKAGTPMIQHPSIPELQRQVMPDEHANLRRLPASLKDAVIRVWLGFNNMVSANGNTTLAQRMLGNGVSRRVWTSVGAWIGDYLKDLKATSSELAQAA